MLTQRPNHVLQETGEVVYRKAETGFYKKPENRERIFYKKPKTDKRASTGVQPIEVAANDMNKHMGARGTPSSSVPKKDKMPVKLDT